MNHNESFVNDRTWLDHFWAPSALLLEPANNLLWIRTERARVRSRFNDAKASSLCLAPWDTRKFLKIFESFEIQQLITNHLNVSRNFGGNPQGCMQSLPSEAPCFKLSAETRAAGSFSADIPCRSFDAHEKSKKTETCQTWDHFFIKSRFDPSESPVFWFSRYFPMAPLLPQPGSFHCTFYSRPGLHLPRPIGDYLSASYYNEMG